MPRRCRYSRPVAESSACMSGERMLHSHRTAQGLRPMLQQVCTYAAICSGDQCICLPSCSPLHSHAASTSFPTHQAQPPRPGQLGGALRRQAGRQQHIRQGAPPAVLCTSRNTHQQRSCNVCTASHGLVGRAALSQGCRHQHCCYPSGLPRSSCTNAAVPQTSALHHPQTTARL